ncbi:MAG TPA: DUF6049 family protein [Jatrophihabitantaceae bacterium]|nr:DUF6049 family protein [Jatrophihabitantaceae bacterium]
MGRIPSRIVAGAGAIVALMSSTVLVGAGPAGAQPTLDDQSVTVAVSDMSPTTPTFTATPSPLTITLALTNTTDQPLYNARIDVDRDAPVTQQKLLEALMAKPAPSQDPSVLSQLTPLPLDSPLKPHETRRLTYKTTTSTANDPGGKNICLCFENGGGVYPINFTAFAAAEQDGVTTQVGFGQTYLPAFKDAPTPLPVSWVWPLIDRPHQVDGTTFIDDDLAASVKPGGRLDRALQVVEGVASKIHLTLVVDPELIDELTTMSTRYFVTVNGKRVEGTGTAYAQNWLKRLKSVVAMAPSTQVSLTPYADPDIDAITAAGLTWSDNFGPQQLQRVQVALANAADSDVAWPADGTVTPNALRQLLSRRTSVVVLNDAALPGTNPDQPNPVGLAPIPAQYGGPGTVAAVTDGNVQSLSDSVLKQGGGPAKLAPLVAELAVRAAENPNDPKYVAITADRYVDASPAGATRAILATARTPWSTSMTLDEAAHDIAPVDHGQLVTPGTELQVPQPIIDAARSASQFIQSFSSALSTSDANALLGGLPAAIQRTESSAWRTDPQHGYTFAGQLNAAIGGWRSGVYIVRPSSGSYTLASNDAPLPITIVNTLPVNVRVRVRVSTANGVAGLRSDDAHVQTIPAAPSATSPTRSTLKLQTHVQRAGTFQVYAELLAPDGTGLGRPVALSIHCTALGAVGVIITAVAGGVLVLALAIRVTRRIRARRKQPAVELSRAEPVAP